MILAAIFSVYPTSTPKQVIYQNNSYSYMIFESKNISLIPNWDNPKKFKDVMATEKCLYGTNGGFYTKQNKPIGLVISDSKVFNPSQNNRLFNGFVSNLGISYELPNNSVWALQTGPMLWNNSQPLKVNTINDKSARRGVAMTTTDNKLYFLIFYNSQAPVLGPYLNDLPEILKLLNISIKSAINLDGGGASAFYDGKTYLDESDPVGTILCAK
jgi:exopolysaccharide biosynthesis protein